MKKNFLYPVMALLMILFAVSCSQEEVISNNEKGGTVSYAVNIPIANPVTRAVPNIPEGYTLRCILQLVDQNNTNITGHRYVETLQAGQDNVTFTFEAPESEYKCLFWADYVKTVAKGSEPADNLYTTTDLTAIGYNLQASAHADMFNTDAADAFYGALLDGSSSITLKRPFAKVSFSSSNAEYNGYNQIEISKFPAPSNFSVVSGSTTGAPATLSYTGSVVDGKWFSAYIFTSTSGSTMGEGNNIEFKLKDSNGTKPEKNLVIEGKNIPLTPNYDISADVTPGANNKTNVTVNFPGDLVDPNAPQPLAVGDFIYKDGKHGKIYNENAIGIVFALAEGKTDGSDYGAGKTVAGYAMGITSITRSTVGIKDNEAAELKTWPMLSLKEGAVWGSKDYSGYKYSKAITDAYANPEGHSILFINYNNWLIENATTGTNLSSWYIPSGSQIEDICNMLFGDNTHAEVKTAYQTVCTTYTTDSKAWAAILNAGKTDGGAAWLLSSCDSGSKMFVMSVTGTDTALTSATTGVGTWILTSSYIIRPVLTIFEPTK